MVKRVTFSKESNIQAVRLLDLGKKSAVELALVFGVRRNQLYMWKERLGRTKSAAFRGPGRKSLSEQGDVARLKRELGKVKQERDTLKKPRRALRETCREVRLHYQQSQAVHAMKVSGSKVLGSDTIMIR